MALIVDRWILHDLHNFDTYNTTQLHSITKNAKSPSLAELSWVTHFSSTSFFVQQETRRVKWNWRYLVNAIPLIVWMNH